MRIVVKQSHIDAALKHAKLFPFTGRPCPLDLPNLVEPQATYCQSEAWIESKLGGTSDSRTKRCDLPEDAREAMFHFDETAEMSPFSFGVRYEI